MGSCEASPLTKNFLQQQYGGYGNSGGGGYGQTNPYEQQGGRYDQGAGNPYGQQAANPYAQQPAAPQPAYGGRQQQGRYDNQYGGGQTTGTTAGHGEYG